MSERLSENSSYEKTYNKERSYTREHTEVLDERSDAEQLEDIRTEHKQLDSGQIAEGILEVVQDGGFGFIRSDNFMPGDNDVYVSPSQIRRFNMKTGDIVRGNTRIKSQGEKYSALLYVTAINGMLPTENTHRYNFEDMTPPFPDTKTASGTSGWQHGHAHYGSDQPRGQRAAWYDRISAESR